MFKFLRSNAKFFYWIIAATFVAFIFVAWGMDMAGSRGGPRQGASSVGSVDGVEISALQYDRVVQEIQTSYRRNSPDQPLTANQIAMAREQAWQQLVRERLLQSEIDRLGLTVSDEEIVRIFKENPPQEVLAAFRTEDGQIDYQAYYAALGNPASGINWAEVENWVRMTLPRQKLIQILVAGASVTDQEVREHYLAQTDRCVAEYVGLALTDMAEDYEPSEAEILAYYEAHPGNFLQGPQGLAKVATWEIAPSPTDFDEVRQLALDVKGELERGDRTFEEAAAIYSEDGSASRGGDLGTFDRNRMVAPFTEAAFALPVGQISDPIQTQFGFHLIEVLEQIEEDGEVTQIHARHILLKVTPSEDTRDAVHEHAAQFRRTVTAQNFLTLASADTTCAVLSPRPFFEGRDIPGLRQSSAGGRFVFRAEPGEISPLMYSEDHVYVVLAEGIQPEGAQELEKVHGQVVLALKRERQQEEAAAKLSPAAGRIQLGEPMAEVAAELGLLHAVTDTIGANANIADVGYATPFNTVALRLEAGDFVPEVATNRGVFALKVLWAKPFDEEDFAARRDQIRILLTQQKQNAMLEAWIQEREESADIRDYRDELVAGL